MGEAVVEEAVAGTGPPPLPPLPLSASSAWSASPCADRVDFVDVVETSAATQGHAHNTPASRRAQY